MPLAKMLSSILVPAGSLLVALHSGAVVLLAQAPPAGPNPTPVPAGFQRYVFWAYGLACVILCFFTLVTFWQASLLRRRLTDLEERFERAHPES